MAEYIALDITFTRQPVEDHECLLAWLSHFGFSGFWEEEGRLVAYIRAVSYNEGDLLEFLDRQGLNGNIESMAARSLPDKNWNEIWESEYQPVKIGSNCFVRAPFHPSQEGVEFDIVIAPKMSFGTAHHETTRGMLQMMLKMDLQGKAVLDLGCGTGILAILAGKMGAKTILALDTDPWAYRNTLENIELNACLGITVLQAELSYIGHLTFDILLANINLNSLLGLMDQFPGRLRPGGILMLSGFLSENFEKINDATGRVGLDFVDNEVMNNWTVAVYRKAD